jgi:signal transduction histidine kinase
VTARPGRRPGSLRRAILLGGIATAVPVAVATVVLVGIGARGSAALADATASLVAEQRIAAGVSEAVMRQIILASAYSTDASGEVLAAFRGAGEEAYGQLRLFLFLDLSDEERLQAERVKEGHERLEVVAARASELFGRGETPEAHALSRELIDRAFTLLDEIDALVQLAAAHMEDIRARQRATFRLIYVAVAAITLLMHVGVGTLVWFLDRNVADPVTRLTEAAGRMEGGDLAVRVQEAGYEEFARLGHAFNRMAASLEDMRADLEQRNAQLSEALDQVRSAQAELVQAEKLSAMGRMTASLAHELNNPLASVLGFAELLAARLDEEPRPTDNQVRQEYLGPIRQEATRAQYLVRNLLRFARRAEDRLGRVELREAMDLVVGLRRYAFQQQGLDIVLGDFPNVGVTAERQGVQGVFLNLTNNALDAMRAGGRGTLRVGAHQVGDVVEVLFDDDGPGIVSPDEVFEPFYTTKAAGEGTGLGLALVYRFMDSVGGSISAENCPEGGARFRLHFRVAQDEGTPEGPEARPARRRVVKPRVSSPRILVVEDEPHLRTLHERLLGRIDAKVFLAESAEEGRRMVAHEDLDVVISDVRMPGESGLDFYGWLSDERPSLASRFLFVTGDIATPELRELAERSPDMFILKPFDVWAYLARVVAVLDA